MSEPFEPFTIPAHTVAGVALAVSLGTCPSAHPRPTRAPGASLLPEDDPALSGGFGVVDTIRLDYTVLGISRTVDMRLPMVIAVVTDQPNVFGCPPAWERSVPAFRVTVSEATAISTSCRTGYLLAAAPQST